MCTLRVYSRLSYIRVNSPEIHRAWQPDQIRDKQNAWTTCCWGSSCGVWGNSLSRRRRLISCWPLWKTTRACWPSSAAKRSRARRPRISRLHRRQQARICDRSRSADSGVSGRLRPLPPRPGLTLVVGRNGSGKSSFAEALEVLLTGDLRRWEKLSAVWNQGWRSMHYPDQAQITAELLIEGAGPVKAKRTWPASADFTESSVSAQVAGEKQAGLERLDWSAALTGYRPFLSHSELEAFFGSPSGLYELLASVLGLEDLTFAAARLAHARKAREAALAEVKKRLPDLLAGWSRPTMSAPRHADVRSPGGPGTWPPPGRRRPASDGGRRRRTRPAPPPRAAHASRRGRCSGSQRPRSGKPQPGWRPSPAPPLAGRERWPNF